MKFNVEFTDTFSGEANYSWVRRATIEAPDNATSRAVIYAARKALGLTGVRGRATYWGDDTIEFRPYRCCVVMFISPV